MTRDRSFTIGALLLVFLAACRAGGPESSAAPERDDASTSGPEAEKRDRVVAQVGGREITLAEVDAAIKPELTRLEMEKYRARKSKIDDMIQKALVEDAAKERGISPDELFTREIASKAPEPTDQEVKEYYDRHKNEIGGSFEEYEARIRQALKNRSMSARQGEFFTELRGRSKVEISLEPPRVNVPTELGIAKGDDDAPIRFIEFSDYQCPYCGRSQEVVKQVLGKYGNQVNHVFMDFPLTSIHPQAAPAAEAARCAGEQGKYWEYHGVLFERQAELSDENFRKWAGELGLDDNAFGQCLGSNKHDAAIERSVEIGQRVGVSGTPAFFVNGILISGAQPFERFEELIESELAEKG